MSRLIIGLTCLVSLAVWVLSGAAASNDAAAQLEESKPETTSQTRVRKGYIVIDHEANDPANADMLAEYVRIAGPLLREYEGEFIVLPGRRGRSEALQGDWNPESFSIIEFPSYQRAKNFYFSPEYQEVLPIRLGTYTGQTKELLVEGR